MSIENQPRDPYIGWGLVDSGTLRAMSFKAAKVFLCLAAHDNPDRDVFPKRPSIAHECGLNVRGVDDAIDELERLNLISVQRKVNQPNHYTVLPTSHLPPVRQSCSAENLQCRKDAPCSAENMHSPQCRKGTPEHKALNTKQENTKQEGRPAAASPDPASPAEGMGTPTAVSDSASGPPAGTSPASPQEVPKRKREKKAKPSRKAKPIPPSDEEKAMILKSSAACAEYLSQDWKWRWWPEGASPKDKVDHAFLNGSKLAALAWFWAGVNREECGLPPAEKLPDGALSGKWKNALKGTTKEIALSWIKAACKDWSAAWRAHRTTEAISPEDILQSWWREKMHKLATQPQPSYHPAAQPQPIDEEFRKQLAAREGRITL